MKLRIKETIFHGVHLFNPQINKYSIRDGYTVNINFNDDKNESGWFDIGETKVTYEEALKVCDNIKEMPTERQIIIHELPEK